MTTYAGLYGPEALIDGTGHPITSATIDVFTHGTTTHVSLYQDNARVTPLSNPVPNGVDGSTAGRGLDTYGNLSFYVNPGVYDLRIVTGAGTRTVEIEVETDPAESAASGLTDKGNWTTATAYAVSDVVTSGTSRYACKTAHTSGTFATDLGAGDWTFVGLATPSTFPPSLPAGTTLAKNYDQGCFYNITPITLRRFLAGVARAQAGGNNLRITCVGDSVTSGANLTASVTGAWYARLQTNLSAILGLPVRGTGYVSSGFMGSATDWNNQSTETHAIWTVQKNNSTTVGAQTNALGVGGFQVGYIFGAGPTPGTLTGSATCDQVVIDFAKRGANGSAVCSVLIDGAAQGAVDLTAGNGLLTKTYAVAQGAHTIVVSPNTTSALGLFVLGAELRSGGATGGMTVSRLSQSAGDTTASGTFGLMRVNTGDSEATAGSKNLIFARQAADLYIIMVGINDAQNAIGTGTFTTNLQAMVTAAQAAGGDAILMMDDPPATSAVPTATYQAYLAAMYAAADAANVGLIDPVSRWTDYVTSNALNYYFDTRHPSATGHADLGNAVTATLQSVL